MAFVGNMVSGFEKMVFGVVYLFGGRRWLFWFLNSRALHTEIANPCVLVPEM